REDNRIKDALVSYELKDDLTSATVRLTMETTKDAGNGFRWIVKDPNGKIVIETQGDLPALHHFEQVSLERPLLWWPNGYGDPNLYTSEVYLLDEGETVVDHRSSRVGFKRVRLL